MARVASILRDEPTSRVGKVLQGTKNMAGDMLQAVGLGLAHVERIPFLGPILVDPVIFSMRNVVQGFDDGKVVIAHARAVRSTNPQEEAAQALSPEDRRTIEETARRAAEGEDH